MMSKTMQDALNEQMKQEFYSSYLYLSMSAYCDRANLPGLAQWMRVQAQEENKHAIKIFDHLLDQIARGQQLSAVLLRHGRRELGETQRRTAK